MGLERVRWEQLRPCGVGAPREFEPLRGMPASKNFSVQYSLPEMPFVVASHGDGPHGPNEGGDGGGGDGDGGGGDGGGDGGVRTEMHEDFTPNDSSMGPPALPSVESTLTTALGAI